MRKLFVLLQRILPPVWCGMILAIGFLEAPLKFRAPGITRELGLGIGKLVFSALNNVEIVLALTLAIALFAFASAKAVRFLFGLVVLVLLLQTFWLIPVLMARADSVIAGNPPADSYVHLVYVVFEAVKIALLLAISVLTKCSEILKAERI